MVIGLVKWLIGFIIILISFVVILSGYLLGGLILLLCGLYIFPFTGYFLRIFRSDKKKKMNGNEICDLCEKPISKYQDVADCTFYNHFLFQELSRPKLFFCENCRDNLDKVYTFNYSRLKFYGVVDTEKLWRKLNGPIRDDIKDIDVIRVKIKEHKAKEKNEIARENRIEKERKERERSRINSLKREIVKLLKDKAVKMPASDIDAHLKHQDVDEIKELCEEMYQDGEISYAGNGRYFILTEEKKQPKKVSAPKSEKVDVKVELKKYKEMLDDGLITQEQYDAKSNELLGL